MNITRGTTTTQIFKVNVPLDSVTDLFITYAQDGVTILEKTLEDVTLDIVAFTITLKLSQADTLLLPYINGNTLVQLRLKYANGDTLASIEIPLKILDILKEGAI